MTYSTNFSGKIFITFFSLVLLLSGCMQGNGSAITVENRPVAAGKNFLVAVLPLHNISGNPAPLADIKHVLIDSLKVKGLNVVGEKALETFITNNRIRYVGGVDRATARALKWQAGAEAVLITTLELYSEEAPPKIAMTCRLISTGHNSAIMWMDGVGLAGDDSIGLFELSLIEDPQKLLRNAVDRITNSLAGYLSAGEENMAIPEASVRFWPEVYHRSAVIDLDTKYTVAVAPFFNISDTRRAGDIIALQFVRQLRKFANFSLTEPGVVRHAMLNYRIIMNDGLSLAQADILFSKLNVDLVLTGKIFHYQDYKGRFGKPKVDFSALLIERKSREVVWSCENHHVGDERVFFFDWGKINTAHRLASEMVASALKTLAE